MRHQTCHPIIRTSLGYMSHYTSTLDMLDGSLHPSWCLSCTWMTVDAVLIAGLLSITNHSFIQCNLLSCRIFVLTSHFSSHCLTAPFPCHSSSIPLFGCFISRVVVSHLSLAVWLDSHTPPAAAAAASFAAQQLARAWGCRVGRGGWVGRVGLWLVMAIFISAISIPTNTHGTERQQQPHSHTHTHTYHDSDNSPNSCKHVSSACNTTRTITAMHPLSCLGWPL